MRGGVPGELAFVAGGGEDLAAAGDDRADRDVVVNDIAAPARARRASSRSSSAAGAASVSPPERLEPFVRDPEVVGDLVDDGLGDHRAELLVVVAGVRLDRPEQRDPSPGTPA